MVHADGAWSLAPESMPFWTRFCDDSIRRWRGVIEIVETVDELVDRAATLRGEIAGVDPDPSDIERLALALSVSAQRLDSVRAMRQGFDTLRGEAETALARLEAWRENPPMLPTESAP